LIGYRALLRRIQGSSAGLFFRALLRRMQGPFAHLVALAHEDAGRFCRALLIGYRALLRRIQGPFAHLVALAHEGVFRIDEIQQLNRQLFAPRLFRVEVVERRGVVAAHSLPRTNVTQLNRSSDPRPAPVRMLLTSTSHLKKRMLLTSTSHLNQTAYEFK